MIFDTHSSILVLFCRRPSLGVGKQRIAAELGEQRALEISQLLLQAALEDAASWHDQVVIAPADARDTKWAAALLPGAHVIPQPEGGLGARIQSVDSAIREQGGRTIVFIGSDAPILDTSTLIAAIARLEHTDTVLAPARDGGVTLLGANKAWPELSTLAWETADLCNSLQTACEEAGLTVDLMPQSYDIDTRDDLPQALLDLEHDPRPGREKLCAWIRKILPSEDRLSVIIPVLNDLPALEALLQQLDEMPGIDEIVVTDGGADADTKRFCLLSNIRYAETPTGRGHQLIAGAEIASGDILWFLHADHVPDSDAANAIRRHLDSGHSGGFFRFRFGGHQRWYKTLLAKAINLRTRFGIPYGDQGLFMKRTAYEQAGGFTPAPLFEEVQLVRRLRQLGNFKPLTLAIDVSPIRWERDVCLWRSIHNRLLACAFVLGIAPEKLAGQYKATGEPN